MDNRAERFMSIQKLCVSEYFITLDTVYSAKMTGWFIFII